ncbi:MAG: hypothetical protein H8E44_12560 [Planctomycetes bacterium]|nr:hypothetical protein [Planctomycetota bacterium]
MPAVKLGGLFVVPLAVAAMIVLVGGRAGFAENSRAPRLLPENTVAYLRIDDVQELVEQFGETALGRMLRDPQVKPFVGHLYGSAAEEFRGIEKDLGLSLDQLAEIPQGEVCLAVVPTKQGNPAMVAMVEVGQKLSMARKVVGYLQAQMEERGDRKTTETWQGAELTVLHGAASPKDHVVFFEREQTIVATSDLELAKQIVSSWGAAKTPNLSGSSSFAAISEQLSKANDEDPQLTYFVDPIKLAKSISTDNMALQVGLSVLRLLGLDGLLGVGGSLTFGGERFESIYHVHVLLDSPVTGVLDVLTLRPGDVTPEVWVPNDVATYMTMHWDFMKSYSAFVEVYDFFQDKDAWSTNVEDPIGKQFGVDMERDVLAALDGRITRITWIDESTSEQVPLLGLKLKDAAAFRRTLGKMVSAAPSLFAKHTVAGVGCFHFSPGTEPDEGGLAGNLPDSCIAILGDYLLIAGSEKLLERAVATKKGDSQPLGQEFDFKLIASMIKRKADGKKPAAIWFERPVVRLRATYETLRSDETKRAVAKLADRNKAFEALHKAMSDSPLPPFSVLEKYFGVSGGLATSDKAGIHGVGFTYRRK